MAIINMAVSSNNVQYSNLETIIEINENYDDNTNTVDKPVEMTVDKPVEMTVDKPVELRDDDIDESFDNKPIEVNLPAPLSTDELNKVHALMKTKSNKELSEIIAKLMTSKKNNTEIEKVQKESSLLKNLSSSSKRELLNMMDSILHQENKHVIFENADSLDTVTKQNKTSHDELRKKLHEKIYMSNKSNLKKMYEKMTEGMSSLQQDSQPQTNINDENNEQSNEQSKEQSKSKKKKSKLNRNKLQSQLMEQLTSLLEEQKTQ
jgi:hypothetical protein